MQNSIVVIIASVLDWKHPFWVNLVQKIKIVCLNRYSVPRLSRIGNRQNSKGVFNFFGFDHIIYFGHICFKNSKLFIQSEI